MRETILRSTMRKVLLALAALHLVWQLGVCLPILWKRTDRDRDMVIYHEAAQRTRRGESPYVRWPEFGPHRTPFRYFYPPSFAAVVAPLGALPFLTFTRLWYVLILLAFWTYAGCLARMTCGRVTVSRWLIAGLILDWMPRVDYALAMGQADPILWALFGLAFCTPALGAMLAAAAQIKLYALWPLLLAGAREGKSVLRPAMLTLAAGTALGTWVCGSDSYLEWARAALPVVSQGTFNPDNVSLSFAGLRLARLLGWQYVDGPLPSGARLYLSTMALLGPLLVAFSARRCERQLQVSCVGVAAVVFAPLCWACYLPLALTPAALFLRRRNQEYGLMEPPSRQERQEKPEENHQLNPTLTLPFVRGGERSKEAPLTQGGNKAQHSSPLRRGRLGGGFMRGRSRA